MSLDPEMCSERDSPLKRLYRRTHAKLTRMPGFRQLVWAAGCELSLALVHAWWPAWPGETSETILRVAPPRKTRPPDHTRVNWPVDASASGSAQVGSGGRHRWAARVQVGREPARQKAGEGYPSHYTSLLDLTDDKSTLVQVMAWGRQATSHYLSQCWPRSMLPYGVTRPQWVNSLAPGRYGCNLKLVIFKLISRVDILKISCEVAIRWMLQDLIDD